MEGMTKITEDLIEQFCKANWNMQNTETRGARLTSHTVKFGG